MTWSLVQRAQELAAARGFASSCSAGTGQLLEQLVRDRQPRRVGEAGTGCGVGTAHLLRHLPPDASLVTIDRDEDQVRAVRELLAADERVEVVTGDRAELASHGPFDLLYLDAGPKPWPAQVLPLLAPGGLAVVDDFTPVPPGEEPWFEGRPDAVRIAYREHPTLACEERQVSPTEAVVLLLAPR